MGRGEWKGESRGEEEGGRKGGGITPPQTPSKKSCTLLLLTHCFVTINC